MTRAGTSHGSPQADGAYAPDPMDLHVGARIKQERIRKDMTQAVLGKAIGVTFQQVQKYEAGINRVSASMLVGIARTLRVEPSIFFPETVGGEPGPEASIRATEPGRELNALFGRLTKRQRDVIVMLARELAASRPDD